MQIRIRYRVSQVCHCMAEEERLCDRLALIKQGKMIAEGALRDLIEQHIEAEAVEVHGDGARHWGDTEAFSKAARIEVSGETVFCYTDNAHALLPALGDWSDVRYCIVPRISRTCFRQTDQRLSCPPCHTRYLLSRCTFSRSGAVIS